MTTNALGEEGDVDVTFAKGEDGDVDTPIVTTNALGEEGDVDELTWISDPGDSELAGLTAISDPDDHPPVATTQAKGENGEVTLFDVETPFTSPQEAFVNPDGSIDVGHNVIPEEIYFDVETPFTSPQEAFVNPDGSIDVGHNVIPDVYHDGLVKELLTQITVLDEAIATFIDNTSTEKVFDTVTENASTRPSTTDGLVSDLEVQQDIIPQDIL